MEYRKLGQAGVKVSRICLGTAFRGQPDDAVCLATIERALDLGCNFVDCANYYGRGRSETIVGKALKGRRDDIVLTTKVWSKMGSGVNDSGSSRFHIMREVERSLQRLQTDHIDVYLLHAFDAETPLEETLGAMDDLVHQGKVRYTGCCNFSAWQVAESLWCSDVNNLVSFTCIQPQYNLLKRLEVEAELLSLCRQHGLGMMTYSPLAVGLLSGRFRRGQVLPNDTPWGQGKFNFEHAMSEQTDAVVQCLIEIAARRGKTPAQVAIAWILDHEEVTAPITGPDLPVHVDEVFGALGWQLEPPERAALDQVSQPLAPWQYV